VGRMYACRMPIVWQPGLKVSDGLFPIDAHCALGKS
jgi:hypothetical protein